MEQLGRSCGEITSGRLASLQSSALYWGGVRSTWIATNADSANEGRIAYLVPQHGYANTWGSGMAETFRNSVFFTKKSGCLEALKILKAISGGRAGD